jgi:hypothetical protein
LNPRELRLKPPPKLERPELDPQEEDDEDDDRLFLV